MNDRTFLNKIVEDVDSGTARSFILNDRLLYVLYPNGLLISLDRGARKITKTNVNKNRRYIVRYADQITYSSYSQSDLETLVH